MPRPCFRLLPLALLLAACATSTTSVESRINRLTQQESALRAAVAALEARQAALRRDTELAQAAAQRARCEAKRDQLTAAKMQIWAQYSQKYAENQACKADAAKGGTLATILGCGLGIAITGGLGLVVCGGTFAAATGIAGSKCQDAPAPPTGEQIHREALAFLRLTSEPQCAPATAPRSTPMGLTGTGRGDPQPRRLTPAKGARPAQGGAQPRG